MGLRQTDQHGEHHRRRAAGRIEIPVADRRIDARVCRLLDALQNGEHPAQDIRRIAGFFIELHLCHLRYDCFHHALRRVLEQISLDDCRLAARHLMFRADAQLNLLIERRGVIAAAQDRAQHLARHLRRGILAARVGIHRLPEHGKHRHGLPGIVLRAHDVHPLMMRRDARGKCAEAVLEEKAHGKPRRIGREPQYAEAVVRVQRHILPIHKLTHRQLAHDVQQIAVLNPLIVAQHRRKQVGIGVLRVLRPEDDRRVAQMHPVLPIREQPVERRAVGEGRILADRRVEPLPAIMRVGLKCRRIEGHQRRAHCRRVLHALDRGMQPRDFCFFPGHQAAHGLHAFRRCVVRALPGRADLRNLLRIIEADLKHQIGRRKLLEKRFHERMGRRLHGIPCVKETQNGRRHRMLHAIKNLMMTRRAGFKAGLRALRLALAVHAQHVRRVVTEEIGRHAAGALHLLRNLHRARHQRLFVSTLDLTAEVFNRPQLSALAEPERIGNLCALPAGRFERSLCRQLFIVAHKRLQDHRTTSQSRRSITPFSIRARKNIG